MYKDKFIYKASSRKKGVNLMAEKQKRDYESASIEVMRFIAQDIITTSSTPTYTPTPGGGMNDEMWDI